jgi:hypothetical protein
MKKFTAMIFIIILAAAAAGTLGCRDRVASAPGAIPTNTPTRTATATMSPTPLSLTYDFENTTNGWSKGGDTGFTGMSVVTAATVPGATVPSGNYCIAVTCNFAGSPANGGEITVAPVPADFTTANTISAYVYLPSDMPSQYSVQIFMLDGGTYSFQGSNKSVAGLQGDWQEFQMPLYGVPGIFNVQTLAVQVLQNGGANWAGTVYVDYVRVY